MPKIHDISLQLQIIQILTRQGQATHPELMSNFKTNFQQNRDPMAAATGGGEMHLAI